MAKNDDHMFIVRQWVDHEADTITGVYRTFDAAKAHVTKYINIEQSQDNDKFEMILKNETTESWKRGDVGIRVTRFNIDG